MIKQSIEKAAHDYATQKTKFRKDVLKEVDADSYVSRHSDCMEDFQSGVRWAEKQSEWISIEERLPDSKDDLVLVKTDRGAIATAYHHGKYSGFITYGEEAYEVFGDITHWMPIPACEE